MNLIVLDTETGGLSPDDCALTSIGVVALRLENGRLMPLEGDEKPREFEVLIRPCPTLRLEAKALEVQGITREELMSDPKRVTEAEALEDFARWLAACGFTPGWPIWAHNAEFDRNHLGAAIRRRVQSGNLKALCGRDSTWACTRYEAQNAVALRCMERPKGDGGKVKPGFSLDSLCHHFGIGTESREAGHGALVDAKLCARVLAKLAAVGGRI